MTIKDNSDAVWRDVRCGGTFGRCKDFEGLSEGSKDSKNFSSNFLLCINMFAKLRFASMKPSFLLTLWDVEEDEPMYQ